MEALDISAGPSAILYTDPKSYSYGYFPMVYDYNGRLPQWLAIGQAIERLPDSDIVAVEPLSALSAFREVIVVDINLRHFSDLHACLSNSCPKLSTAPVVAKMLGSGRWALISERRVFGIYDVRLTRLRLRT